MASNGGSSWLPPVPHRLDTMGGPGQTNWIIKGLVLTGPHPGQISTAEMVKHLTAILSEGITTFACLQAEMPSPLTSANHPRVGVASQSVGVTARPYINDAQIIVDHGRGRFPQREPLSFIHLPIPDDGAAVTDDEKLVPFVLDLISHLKAGEKLYIHCNDGNGRTGTVACALLGLLYNLSSSETLDLVQRFRNHRAGTQGHMPDSHEQKMQVHRLLADDRLRAAAASVPPKKSSDPDKALAADVTAIINKVRHALARRGTSSMIALSRAFRIMDDNRSRTVSMSEFQKGMRDFGVGLTRAEVEAVFQFYDRDGNGELSFNEFLRGVRGDMNPRRKALVQQAFQKLDFNGNGHVELDDIAQYYKARNHPDVLAGKKTEKQVLTEFLDTFDVTERDQTVTLEEFEEYYSNISASIDDDNYFQLMMWNAWPFAGKQDRSARRRVGGPKNGAGAQRAAGVARYGATGAGGAGAGSGDASLTGRVSRGGQSAGLAIYGAGSEAARLRAGQPAVDAPGTGGSRAPDELLRALRSIMKRRGARGIVGLGRSFRNMDDDRSHSLNRYEFGKAMNDVGLRGSRAEIDGLFAHFDHDRSGHLDYEEFLRSVRGPMSERRAALVRRAFDKLDHDRSGVIDVSEVASSYNAERHPRVLNGEASPQDVYRTFLDTFDQGVKDGRVTLDEFMQYYQNVGSSIDSDDYFEAMMVKCWNLDEKPAARTAWAGDVGAAPARRAAPTFSSPPPHVSRHANGKLRSNPGAAGTSSHGHLRRGKKAVGGSQSKTYASNVPWDMRDTAMGTGSEVAALRASYVRSPEKAARVLASAGAGLADTGVAGAGAGAGAGAAPGPADHVPRGVERVQARLRDQLKRRGAKGIIGLGRAFRVFDDDGSRSLNRYEFGKALKDYGLALSNSEINLLWNHYDQDNSGHITYDEFIRGVRGVLNPRRKELVHQAFRKLDANGNGVVEVDDIRLAYDASHHPDVVSGRKTEADVLRAFLDTFDAGDADGRVTLEEFEEYYANISASIDDDNYFQLMMWNAWRLQDGPTASPGFGQRTSHGRHGGFTQALAGAPTQSSRGWVAGETDVVGDVSEAISVDDVLKRVRMTIARRGTGSVAGLAKAFKIFDDDRSGDLDLYEFSKAMRDYGVGLSEAELRALFNHFDHDRNGKIHYMEFLRGVRGQMSETRRALVSQAFARIDTDQSGVLTYEDLRSHYNAKQHKDVLSGRLTEKQAIMKFLNTFDGLQRDGVVTAEEFEDYYANVSASVDDDAYFQLMMWNSWNLGGATTKRSQKKAWAGEF